jgi:hypothetical protein
MKIGLAVFAVVLALGAGSAEAARRKFPKPIDSPVVRPKVKEYHKPGTRVKHMENSAVDGSVPSDVVRA